MEKNEYLSKSTEETMKIAAKFAETLLGGDIILLDGDLGAGKTVFTKGIVSKLSNGKIQAISPTFVMLNIYDTKPVIYHFDLYRITDIFELQAIGFEEYIYSNGISIIEWPSRAFELFPKNVIKVTILKIGDSERKIVIER